MASNSSSRLMGGGRPRRKKARSRKSTKPVRTRPAVVKVKIKGTLKQVRHAAKKLAEGVDENGSQSSSGTRKEEQTEDRKLG